MKRSLLALLLLALFYAPTLGQTPTRQPYVHTAPAINSATTSYHYGLAGLRAWSVTAANENVMWEQSGTFNNFCVDESVASGGGITTTYTIRVNGSNTALAVPVTNSTATTCNTGSTASITAGQSFVIERSTSGGTPANSAPTFTLEFVPTTPNLTVYGGVTQALSNVDAFFNVYINPSTTAASVTGPNERSILPLAGTMTSWNVRLTVTPGVGDTRTFCWVKNTVTQDGTAGTPNTCIAITGNGPVAGSSSVDMSVSANDIMTFFMDIGGNPDAAAAQISWTFEPTVPGGFMIGASPTGNTSNNTEFIALGGNNWSTAEALLLTPRSSFNFTAVAGLASAANDGRTLLIRKDGATPGGTPTATMAGGLTPFNATGGPISYTSANTWSIRTSGTGTLDLTWAVGGIIPAEESKRFLLLGVGPELGGMQ